MEDPTREEILKVRKWECNRNGHEFEVIQSLSHGGPVAVTCNHCGENWAIEKKKVDEQGDVPQEAGQ